MVCIFVPFYSSVSQTEGNISNFGSFVILVTDYFKFITAIFSSTALGLLVVILFMVVSIVAEYYLLRKFLSHRSGVSRLRLLIRFVNSQVLALVYASGLFFVTLVLSYLICLTVAMADINLAKVPDTANVIKDNPSISAYIAKSQAIIRPVYLSGQAGVLMANRNIRDRSRISLYYSNILSYYSEIFRTTAEDSPFYLYSDREQIVVGSIAATSSQDVLSRLVQNNLQYSNIPGLQSRISVKPYPQIRFVSASEFYEKFSETRKGIISGLLKELEDAIKFNENGKAECRILLPNNEKILKNQKLEYDQLCKSNHMQSSCTQLAERIKSNEILNNQAEESCGGLDELIRNQKNEMDRVSDILSKDLDITNKSKYENIVAIFVPPNQILIKIDTRYTNASFLKNVFHEYLHYYSFNDKEWNLPSFLMEGVTEYLTMRSVGVSETSMAQDRISGYELHTQIVMALLEKIPLSELSDLYLNAKPFKPLFQKYFPNSNYEDFVRSGNEIDRLIFEYRLSPTYSPLDYIQVRKIRVSLGLSEYYFRK